MYYLDQVIMDSKVMLVVAMGAMWVITIIVAFMQADKSFPERHKLTQAWLLASLLATVLTILFPKDARQWREITGLLFICWPDIAIWGFGLISYVGLCWILPYKVFVEAGGYMRIIAAIHVAILAIIILCMCGIKLDARNEAQMRAKIVSEVTTALMYDIKHTLEAQNKPVNVKAESK